MRARFPAALLLLLAATPTARAQVATETVRRFVQTYLPHGLGSIEVNVNATAALQGGSYQVLAAKRTNVDGGRETDSLILVIDITSRTAFVGMTFPIQVNREVPVDQLPGIVELELPKVIKQLMSAETRVRWPAGLKPVPAVVPLTAEISTGYGWMRYPVALTADAKWLTMGPAWPIDRDVREVRRERLDGATIQWDLGHEAAILKLVEFSDYQCPACKRQWLALEPALTAFGDTLRHGLVNFPLVTNHPWSFRAAVAGVCIADIWPDQALTFKSEMYRLQPSLTVETVDDGVFGFLAQRGLPEASFRTCYLKDPSVNKVIYHLELGQSLGVQATPTFIVNGEWLPLGNVEAITARLQAIVAAGGRPEHAGSRAPAAR
jgi:protein-disulfide isomerase